MFKIRSDAGFPAHLQEGWVIANHILVSFHVAFISSILALPSAEILKGQVLKFIFASPETMISAIFTFISFHSGIALHEMGHFLTAAKLNALNDRSQSAAMRILRGGLPQRIFGLARVFISAPYGRATGIKREGLNYYPDAAYNLAVAAAGPRASRNAALALLPPAGLLLSIGIIGDALPAIYLGRLFLGIGIVSLLDFLLADQGKFREFRERERRAHDKAASVARGAAWWEGAAVAKQRMLNGRLQEITHPRLGLVTAPWQFRNCGMGGRHTEKEYPESNISMQEAMFLILGARDYQEAQEVTVRLQNRLKEIIEKAEGCRVMGIGLEGGISPYIERGPYPVPEFRLWVMMKQAIEECGHRPGVDVAIALDPAMSELEIAYRRQFKVPDSVGMYLFWRDKALTVMDRDSVLDLYLKAIKEHDLPILSIEDGFSEHDYEGWRKLLLALGDRLFVIGDDLVTTNDATIELAAAKGLINTVLIKANQIGSLYETILAMMVALGKGMELVVSHRSKSPNDDMEAQIALAVNALGLKAGGGANTERLLKYHAVAELMQRGAVGGAVPEMKEGQNPILRAMYAYEEPTNAGIPTVGVTVEFSLPEAGICLKFKGATPLGTSAGTGEAIHLVDASFERAEYPEVIDRHPSLFVEREPGVFAFAPGVRESQIRDAGDEEITLLFERAERYGGKGCLHAVENVGAVIAPAFAGKISSSLTLKDIDRTLLGLELQVARRRGKIGESVPQSERIQVMQRKQNLGMNAMLSVSLALARGLAHLRGKDLFELMREEIMAVTERLCRDCGIKIAGSQFSDYVEALKKANGLVEGEGRKLHEVLRDLTAIYSQEESGLAEATSRLRDDLAPFLPEAALEFAASIIPKLGKEYLDNPHHGLRHTRDLLARAAGLVSRLGAEKRIDWRVLAAAVCFHDVGSARGDHGEEGAALARAVLASVKGLAAPEIVRIEEAVRLHQDRSVEGARRRAAIGLEAQILYDVDQLDAFGAKGIYRYVVIYMERGSLLDDILGDARARFKSLTFDETRKLGAKDFDFMESFLMKIPRGIPDQRTILGEAGVVNWIKNHPRAEPVSLSDEALSALERQPPGPDRELAVDFFKSLRRAYLQPEAITPEEVPSPKRPPVPGETEVLTAEEQDLVSAVGRELLKVYRSKSERFDRHRALHQYLMTKQIVARRAGRFGIVNNRVFLTPKSMLIPYLVADTILVHAVDDESTRVTRVLPVPQGMILTDDVLRRKAGVRGEPIDLEKELFEFAADQAAPVRVGRIRDMVDELKKINESANRNEALYVLRILVARLSLLSFREYLNAKNLQPEVHNLFKELVRFINMPLSRRLPFLVRFLVRDIATVVTRPKLIDRLWNDTIDLAEIHVRGSSIVNELRRSTHHAVGKHTLRLAEAYGSYLATGEADALAELGFAGPARSDEEARSLDRPKEIVSRIVDDLRLLLGASETVTRIREWQVDYGSTLVRCEFGNSLIEETKAALEGMCDKNRWVYYHHVRIIKSRVQDFVDHLPDAREVSAELEALLGLKPDEAGFDLGSAKKSLEGCVGEFIEVARRAYQEDFFRGLEDLVGAYERREFDRSFESICRLRKGLRNSLEDRAFPEQRLLLLQLDCILEEMGYLALRHVSNEYDERGVDFLQCLEILHACVLNLTQDGLHSRQLLDLATMLRAPGKTYSEIRNVVEQIQRNYHHIVQRVISPFEKLREKIEFSEEELRIALANMQRCMLDLNSIAEFSDIARTYVEDKVKDRSGAVGATPGPAEEPYDVIHFSHRDDVRRRTESGDPARDLRDLYGGKGSGLIYISYLNIPTRDGFVFPTTLARRGLHKDKSEELGNSIRDHLRILESDIARRDGRPKTFGSPENSLLLAVRGGSVFSMPGMLSSILFVGINDEIAAGLANEDPWCAYDSYRRFLALYARAVWGLDIESFNVVEDAKQRYKVKYKSDLPWEGMKEIVEATKTIIQQNGHGRALEDALRNPFKQLSTAVRAVFDSWDGDGARRYREIKGICDSWHTAAIVQEMSLGNRRTGEIGAGMDETESSLTGVILRTRVVDPGLRSLMGDYKFSAAGEDLVGGLTKLASFSPIEELESCMPMLTRRLRHIAAKLRRFMGTDQEIEFTVERGVLSILQSRAAEVGKNRREAAFENPGEEATRGIGVRGGAFRGIVAFDTADIEELAGEDFSRRDDADGIILVLESPAPEHIHLILAADALLAAKGGSSSHAAITVNGIEDRDYFAVMSAAGLAVDAHRKEAVIIGKDGTVRHTIHKGDVLSIHGTTGSVFLGARPVS